MKNRVSTDFRYVTQKEIDRNRDDKNFTIKEPGLLIWAVIKRKSRAQMASPQFIPEKFIRQLLGVPEVPVPTKQPRTADRGLFSRIRARLYGRKE